MKKHWTDYINPWRKYADPLPEPMVMPSQTGDPNEWPAKRDLAAVKRHRERLKQRACQKVDDVTS